MATKEQQLIPLFEQFLKELEERLTNPFKYEYKAGEIFTGKAIGKAGTPRPPRLDKETSLLNKCKYILLNKDNIFKNACEYTTIYAQQHNIPITIPSSFQIYPNKNLVKSEITLADVKEKIKYFLNLFLDTINNNAFGCNGLERLVNLAKSELIKQLMNDVRDSNNVHNTNTKIEDPVIRRLSFLFGRCGQRGLEDYLKVILEGVSSPTWSPHIFDYEFIPYMPRKNSPTQALRNESLKKLPANLERTFQTRPNPNSDISHIFVDYAASRNFSALKHALEGQGKGFAKNFVQILEDNILAENIPYYQGYDAIALDFLLMAPEKAKDLHYYFLREYLFGDVTMGHIYENIMSQVLRLADAKKYEDVTKSDIGIETVLKNTIAHISQKSFSSSTRILEKNGESKTRSINFTMRTVLYDLLFRTSPYFIFYFVAIVFKQYFKIEEEVEDALYESQILLYAISNYQLEYAMTKHGVTGISIEQYEKDIEAQPTLSARIASLGLFDSKSPFRKVLAETLQLMLNELPHHLVQSALTADEYEEFKNSRNNHLLYDPFSVYNAYMHIKMDFEDRLTKPLKYGIGNAVCWTKGFKGIKGMPKICSSKNEIETLSSCVQEIGSYLNEINRLFKMMDYTRTTIKPAIMHKFILKFNELHQTLQTSEACQKLERIRQFAKNTGTSTAGDIAFLKNLAEPFVSLPTNTIGGKRTQKTKTQRKQTRKGKGLRSRTLKRR